MNISNRSPPSIINFATLSLQAKYEPEIEGCKRFKVKDGAKFETRTDFRMHRNKGEGRTKINPSTSRRNSKEEKCIL